jgi:hypothetical protein
MENSRSYFPCPSRMPRLNKKAEIIGTFQLVAYLATITGS